MDVTRLGYRVIYADCDAMGVVYHGNYLRLAEAGRNQYCRDHGLAYKDIEKAGFFFPVIEAHVKYLRPALFEDELDVAVWLSRRTRVRLEFDFEIRRGPELLVAGHTVHACINREGRPIRLPTGFEDRFPVHAARGPTHADG
ncbi:MAG: acyl-CoA thioesterase [Deltaproteobacteria bacterium]|nr:acyl-CoA thioesterase [Deltaproteobacteria bacterium]